MSEAWKYQDVPRLYCSTCGRGESVPMSAPMPGACPDCGGTSWTNNPQAFFPKLS